MYAALSSPSLRSCWEEEMFNLFYFTVNETARPTTDVGAQANFTVLVTLLRCIVNCTAYPIQELCGPFPQKQGLGPKGLGWRFLTLTERALKEMKSN